MAWATSRVGGGGVEHGDEGFRWFFRRPAYVSLLGQLWMAWRRMSVAKAPSVSTRDADAEGRGSMRMASERATRAALLAL